MGRAYCVSAGEQQTILFVKVKPNASSNEIAGVLEDADGQTWLKLKVTTVPEKGKANKDVIALLARKLKLPKSVFQIIAGETDRSKKVLVEEAAGRCRQLLFDML